MERVDCVGRNGRILSASRGTSRAFVIKLWNLSKRILRHSDLLLSLKDRVGDNVLAIFGTRSSLRGIKIVLIAITSGTNLADRRFFY